MSIAGKRGKFTIGDKKLINDQTREEIPISDYLEQILRSVGDTNKLREIPDDVRDVYIIYKYKEQKGTNYNIISMDKKYGYRRYQLTKINKKTTKPKSKKK